MTAAIRGISRAASVVAKLLFPGIAVIFVVFRVYSASDLVFSDSGEVHLLGNDPFFHVRHAEYSASHFPALLRYDPGSHYPKHDRQQASGLFNLVIAGVAIISSGFSPTRSSVEHSAAWIPVILGFLALLVLFRFGKSLGGVTTGLFAAVIFTVYPGTSIFRSLLGFADQHVAEFLLAILSVACLVRCLDQTSRSGPESWRRPALLLGAPLAAFFYTWMGTPMYIAIFAMTIFVSLLLTPGDEAKMTTLGRGYFRYFSAVAIWQLVVLLFWPDLIMEVVDGMRWWNLMGMVALAVLPWLYVHVVHYFLKSGTSTRVVVAASIVIVSVSVILFFSILPQGRVFADWLLKERGTEVSEQRAVTLGRLWSEFGTAGLLALLSIPLVAVWRRSQTMLQWAVIPVLFGVSITLIWYRTHDFDYVPPVFIALMGGLAIGWLIDQSCTLVAKTFPQYRMAWWREPLTAGFFLVLLLAPIRPLLLSKSPWLSVKEIKPYLLTDVTWREAMYWLRDNSPEPSITPTSDNLRHRVVPYPEDSYGVMSGWHAGNIVAYAGHRMPVSSRYPSKADAAWLTAQTETEADSLLCERCRSNEHVKYIVLDVRQIGKGFLAAATTAERVFEPQTNGVLTYEGIQVPYTTYGNDYDQAIVTRLMRDDGRDLSRYRLVYESYDQSLSFYMQSADFDYFDASSTDLKTSKPADIKGLLSNPIYKLRSAYAYDAHLMSKIKIFEVVSGARLLLKADPGTELTLELPLHSSATNRSLTYSRTSLADSTGRASFTVPYWTQSVSTTDLVKPTGPYTVRTTNLARDLLWQIDLEESDVRAGSVLEISKAQLEPRSSS